MAAYQFPLAGFSGLVKVGDAVVNPVLIDANALAVLGYARDQTITVNSEPLDVTNYQSNGWMEHIVGLRSWEVSAEALYVDADAGLNVLRGGSLSLLPLSYPPPLYSFAFFPMAQGVAPEETTFYVGNGVLASFEIADPVDDAVTVTFSITGSGPLAVKLTTEAPPSQHV